MATQMIDVALDDTEDILITAGDLLLIESTAQHQRQLMLNNNGDFKQNPGMCVGVADYFDDENYQDLMRKISMEFTKDGMDVKAVRLNNKGIVSTDAYYP